MLHYEQKGESIKSYLKRLNEIKIEVLHCDKAVVAMAFCKDLLPNSKLYHSIVKTRLETMEEVLKQA